jgi:uncharacterized membrane protein YdjX (TVP38/TMEM64 family)
LNTDTTAKKKTDTEGNLRKGLPYALIFFALSALCIVFSILCLNGTRFTFIVRNLLFFTILSVALIYGFCIVSVIFALKRKEGFTKSCLSIFIFLVFCLVLIYIFQRTGFFQIMQSSESLQAYLEQTGAWMPILYVVLQYLQVVILPIPSVVSTVAGVTLFGPLQATVYSLIGIILGSITAFVIGRKLGNKAVRWMIGEDSLKKWQKKLKGKDNLFLTIMFLLPMFPDDVLCFIAGLSSMSTKYFLIMILISRLISISTTCYSVDIIPFNTWWGLLVWGILIVAIVMTFILIYKNMDAIQVKLGKRFKIFRKKGR